MMFARFREGIRLAHEREKRRKAIVEAGAWWSKRTKEADKLLPTNKRFGRYRPIQTSEGWGVWEGGANRGTKPYWAAAKSAPGAQVSAARGARARGRRGRKPRPRCPRAQADPDANIPLRFVHAGASGSCDDTHVSRLPTEVLEKQLPRIKDTRSLNLRFQIAEPGSLRARYEANRKIPKDDDDLVIEGRLKRGII